MKNWKTTSAIAAVLALQVSAAAAADSNDKPELPQSGAVSLSGTVDRLVDNDTFILRDDRSGKTVDVHTTATANVNAGEKVKVQGTADSEMLGMGHKIVQASVTPAAGGEPLDNDAPSSGSTNSNTGATSNPGTDSTSGSAKSY